MVGNHFIYCSAGATKFYQFIYRPDYLIDRQLERFGELPHPIYLGLLAHACFMAVIDRPLFAIK